MPLAVKQGAFSFPANLHLSSLSILFPACSSLSSSTLPFSITSPILSLSSSLFPLLPSS